MVLQHRLHAEKTTTVYGNFDIILDQFSRISQRYVAPHARRAEVFRNKFGAVTSQRTYCMRRPSHLVASRRVRPRHFGHPTRVPCDVFYRVPVLIVC